jgi:hypothetical protein
MRDTSSSIQATTQPDSAEGREIKVSEGCGYEVTTGAQYTAGSMPSGLPEAAGEGGSYVFRVGAGLPLDQVVITIDTRQLTEQARIRKMNREIRRAHRR